MELRRDAVLALEDEQDEAAVPVAIPAPLVKTPSLEQRKAHELTHVPYKDWCPVCVASKGRDLPHKRQEAKGVLEFPWWS